MKGSPHLRPSVIVIAILTVILLAGGWSAPLNAAAPGVDLRPAAPSAAGSITLLAVADTTVKSGFPTMNFGSTDTLDLEYAGGVQLRARPAAL